MILIVSTVADAATDAVVRELAVRHIPHLRVNTEDYPFERSITVDYQDTPTPGLHYGHREVNEPSAIWYRRVRSAPIPENMDSGVYEFCLRENRAVLVGSLLTQNSRWMNHPSRVWTSEFKPYQLHIAQRLGLKIPKTILSNDPGVIRRAYEEFGSLIVKPARSGYVNHAGAELSIYTSRIDAAHLKELDAAKWAPSIFQECIPKAVDIRVTIVGTQIFAAAIHSQTDPSATIDWRRTANPRLPHSRHDIGVELRAQLLRLQTDLGLSFGCIDMILTPDGEYVFLEVNPSGQWLWLEDQLDLNISGAIADWLSGVAC